MEVQAEDGRVIVCLFVYELRFFLFCGWFWHAFGINGDDGGCRHVARSAHTSLIGHPSQPEELQARLAGKNVAWNSTALALLLGEYSQGQNDTYIYM